MKKFDNQLPETGRDKALYEPLVTKNIENFVGLARVPVGLAGPLLINGRFAQGEFYVPLATTEGTLVASTSRGMKVLNESGGVKTQVVREGGIQRAPVFQFATVSEAADFAQALEQDWAWLKPVVESTTKHGKLESVQTFVLGSVVHVRFSLRPGSAAGQNMVSIAALKGVEAILERYPQIQKLWMEGGFSGEKVPSNLNMLFGRGYGVVAEVEIPGRVLQTITRTNPQDLVQLFEIYVNANLWGGSKNSHASLINILPALYIATGQDVASVPESCMAQNRLVWQEKEQILLWELICPNIVAGTVGGGTGLPTQKECLELLGCAGAGQAQKFVEICAATALANEISFWSAICANEWVQAHASLKKR